MPEFPDVELIRRAIIDKAQGQTIQEAAVLEPKLIKDVPDLKEKLTGKKILGALRHGKYLFIHCDVNGYLVLHFGLNGTLLFKTPDEKLPPASHLVLKLERLSLVYQSWKLFGMAGWCSDVAAFVRSRKMGPDVLAMPEEQFVQVFRNLKGTIKPALMDQQHMAGIGNAYADEILFQCKVHPKTPAARLNTAQLKKIHSQIRQVFDWALEVKGDRSQMPEGTLLRDRGKITFCPRCHEKIKKAEIGGRETLFCPACQQLPEQQELELETADLKKKH